MSEYNNQRNYERRPNAFNNQDIRLWAKNQEDAWASMSFNVEATGRKHNDNVFVIRVYTNVSSEERTPIIARMDAVTFGSFCSLLKEAINAQPDTKTAIFEMNRPKWTKNDKGKNVIDGTIVESRVHIGKDAEGRVYIAVTANKRNNIKFVFHRNKNIKLCRADGTEMPESETSVLAARSYLRIFEEWTYKMLQEYYQEPEQNENNYSNQNNRSNNGYHQSNQRSQSQSQSSSDDFDFDVPM